MTKDIPSKEECTSMAARPLSREEAEAAEQYARTHISAFASADARLLHLRALAGTLAYHALVERIEQERRICDQLAFKAPGNSETRFVMLQKAELLRGLLEER